jgi:hypothetical protein
MGPPLLTVNRDQSLNPDDRIDQGSKWEDLATVNVTAGTLIVDLANGNAYVMADAIRIERLGPAMDSAADSSGDIADSSGDIAAGSGDIAAGSGDIAAGSSHVRDAVLFLPAADEPTAGTILEDNSSDGITTGQQIAAPEPASAAATTDDEPESDPAIEPAYAFLLEEPLEEEANVAEAV